MTHVAPVHVSQPLQQLHHNVTRQTLRQGTKRVTGLNLLSHRLLQVLGEGNALTALHNQVNLCRSLDHVVKLGQDPMFHPAQKVNLTPQGFLPGLLGQLCLIVVLDSDRQACLPVHRVLDTGIGASPYVFTQFVITDQRVVCRAV